MSKRKGLSLEEKRTRMLQLFYEKKDFFQLKELEKIAPKEKGIIAQSVKDVVQGLVDDELVDTDKIGTSVYFWAYPSKAKHTRKRKLEDITNRLNESSAKLARITDNLSEAHKGKEDSAERSDLLIEIKTLKQEESKLQNEVDKYKDSDPQVFEKIKQDCQVAKEASNRWTDNIFAIKSWCKNKVMIEESILDKQFGLPADFDYVE